MRRGGQVRSDIPADELTSHILHALGAASTLPTDTASERLVRVILDALHADD